MKTKPSITNFQYGVLIIGALIANGIFTMPRVVTAESGRSAWVVIAVVGLTVMGATLLAHLLASLHPNQDPADWVLNVLGPFFGRIWLLVYLIRSCFFLVLTAKLYAGIISNRMLMRTPSSVIAAIVLVLCIMAVLAKLGGLARFAELSFFVWAPLLLLFVAIISPSQLVVLRPVFGDASLTDMLKSSRQAAYGFAGFDFVLFVYPFLQKRKGSTLTVIISVLFVTAAYVLITVSATVFLGVEQMTRLLAPTLVVLSTPETSVVQRFDSLAIFLWIGMEIVTGATQLHIATRATQGIFKKVAFHKAAITLGTFLIFFSWGHAPLRDVATVADVFGIFDLAFITLSIVALLALSYLKKVRERDAPST